MRPRCPICCCPCWTRSGFTWTSSLTVAAGWIFDLWSAYSYFEPLCLCVSVSLWFLTHVTVFAKACTKKESFGSSSLPAAQFVDPVRELLDVGFFHDQCRNDDLLAGRDHRPVAFGSLSH